MGINEIIKAAEKIVKEKGDKVERNSSICDRYESCKGCLSELGCGKVKRLVGLWVRAILLLRVENPLNEPVVVELKKQILNTNAVDRLWEIPDLDLDNGGEDKNEQNT